MEIFLNPNVAYLALVMAFLLSFLAIIVPGTGLIEILALFALIAAGYSVYNLPLNYLALGLLVLGVFPFLLALRKSGRMIFLVISILALVAGSIFLFRGEGWKPAVNPLLALIVSSLAAIFLWITARKSLEASQAPPAYDLQNLIGEKGEAATDIYDEGSVQMESELWSARSQQLIPAGSKVRVIGREGLILVVEKA